MYREGNIAFEFDRNLVLRNRITEGLRLEGALKIIKAQPPSMGRVVTQYLFHLEQYLFFVCKCLVKYRTVIHNYSPRTARMK